MRLASLRGGMAVLSSMVALGARRVPPCVRTLASGPRSLPGVSGSNPCTRGVEPGGGSRDVLPAAFVARMLAQSHQRCPHRGVRGVLRRADSRHHPRQSAPDWLATGHDSECQEGKHLSTPRREQPLMDEEESDTVVLSNHEAPVSCKLRALSAMEDLHENVDGSRTSRMESSEDSLAVLVSRVVDGQLSSELAPWFVTLAQALTTLSQMATPCARQASAAQVTRQCATASWRCPPRRAVTEAAAGDHIGRTLLPVHVLRFLEWVAAHGRRIVCWGDSLRSCSNTPAAWSTAALLAAACTRSHSVRRRAGPYSPARRAGDAAHLLLSSSEWKAHAQSVAAAREKEGG